MHPHFDPRPGPHPLQCKPALFLNVVNAVVPSAVE